MSVVNDKVTIHFAHANGFPAASYKKLFEQLPKNFHVLAVDKFGHDKRFPVTDNWQYSVQELIHHVEDNTDDKVFAVGHSFGAVISYMAVCQRPELFHGLIMLDPPLITSPIRHLVRVLKKTPLVDKISPAGKAAVRRNHWSLDSDIAKSYSKSKLFENFDPDCLQDYVDAGFSEYKNKLVLNFKPEVEADIFRNLPVNINSFFGKLTRPALLVTGSETDVCLDKMVNRFMAQNTLEHQVTPGGHMFPLEHPNLTASLISDQILQWCQAISK